MYVDKGGSRVASGNIGQIFIRVVSAFTTGAIR